MMLSAPWIAVLIAMFSWWFSTGIILLAVRRADIGRSMTHGKLVAFYMPLFALGLAGLVVSAGALTVTSVYVAFLSVLLIWGWIELAFLTGIVTGPERRPCPPGLVGWARFTRAWHALSHHEMLLLCGLLIVTVVTTGSDNTFGFWTYIILFTARISAKLNLFFGVPRINTEFMPKPLQHLKSYFRQGNVTAAFFLGVTFLSLTAACFGERMIAAETAASMVGFALLTALATLAALEHWVMVIPLPDAKLWRWMLPAAHSTTKTGRSHEL